MDLDKLINTVCDNTKERKVDLNVLKNYATDCSINQLIPNLNIPKDAVMPDSLKHMLQLNDIKLKESAEYYYSLFKDSDDSDDTDSSDDSDNSENSDGSDDSDDSDKSDSSDSSNDSDDTKDSNGSDDSEKQNKSKSLDTHSKWTDTESEYSEDLMKDITSKMIQQSMEETIKQRGTLPQDIEKMINLFTEKAQVDWKKVLRKITGNKKANKRSTIMKRDRRFPNRMDLYGKTKDRTFELVVAIDTSGSMDSYKDIIVPLNEVRTICKLNNTTLKLIQIDTEIKSIGTFDKNTKSFNRRGFGGTRMEPLFPFLKENHIGWDAIIFLSDMYIEELSEWAEIPRKPIIWLSNTPLDKGVQVQKYHRQRRFLIEAP